MNIGACVRLSIFLLFKTLPKRSLAEKSHITYISTLMKPFTRDLLFYKLPPFLYALFILSLSLWAKGKPPIDLGVSWEDKVYHFTEYFIFGFLIFRAFSTGLRSAKRRNYTLLLFIFGWTYGALDEIVQYFVPGRDSAVGDWAADAIGYSVAALLLIWFYSRRATRTEHL